MHPQIPGYKPHCEVYDHGRAVLTVRAVLRVLVDETDRVLMGSRREIPVFRMEISFELAEADLDLNSPYRLPPPGFQTHPCVQALQCSS